LARSAILCFDLQFRGFLGEGPDIMASVRSHAALSYLTYWPIFVALLSFNIQKATAANDTRWIKYTGNDDLVWLDDARRPSLYTSSFEDCQGDSLINVTRFDAAYYKDNMTVLFHLEGDSALHNESLMRESPAPASMILTHG
jgi:hypothetical protein